MANDIDPAAFTAVRFWLAAVFVGALAQLRGGFGSSGKAIVAIAILAGVALMVMGYRSADTTVFWGRTPALVGINNLLMLKLINQ